MIDDNTINSEMIAFMIGDDYNLKFATDGLRGLSVLRENKDISLILLDLIMPNMNGREFLVEVKKNPETMDIPVPSLAPKIPSIHLDTWYFSFGAQAGLNYCANCDIVVLYTSA